MLAPLHARAQARRTPLAALDRRGALASLALALALQPARQARAEENFFETWPYVEPADVLPFVRSKAVAGNADSVLDALDEFCLHYPMYALGREKGVILGNLAANVKPRAALEVGTLFGYSAIRTARELAPGGRLVCIEANPAHAAVARTLLDLAGVGDRVEVLTGLSSDLAPRAAELLGGADWVFLDHAKECYAPDTRALEALGVLRTGSLLVADNVIYPGAPGFLELVQGNAAKYETRLVEAAFEYRVSWREGLGEEKRDALSVTRYL